MCVQLGSRIVPIDFCTFKIREILELLHIWREIFSEATLRKETSNFFFLNIGERSKLDYKSII